VQLLLDTHAFYWWLAGSPRLSKRARQSIADPANVKFVSAASAWEFVTKFRAGREPGFATLAADVVSAIASQGFAELALSVRHAELAVGLPMHHRDPFDRMLIAQSLLDDLPVITGGALFRPYGCKALW
jgi:PIN domain nuclease of toxin-antitoxin system